MDRWYACKGSTPCTCTCTRWRGGAASIITDPPADREGHNPSESDWVDFNQQKACILLLPYKRSNLCVLFNDSIHSSLIGKEMDIPHFLEHELLHPNEAFITECIAQGRALCKKNNWAIGIVAAFM